MAELYNGLQGEGMKTQTLHEEVERRASKAPCNKKMGLNKACNHTYTHAGLQADRQIDGATTGTLWVHANTILTCKAVDTNKHLGVSETHLRTAELPTRQSQSVPSTLRTTSSVGFPKQRKQAYK